MSTEPYGLLGVFGYEIVNGACHTKIFVAIDLNIFMNTLTLWILVKSWPSIRNTLDYWALGEPGVKPTTLFRRLFIACHGKTAKVRALIFRMSILQSSSYISFNLTVLICPTVQSQLWFDFFIKFRGNPALKGSNRPGGGVKPASGRK